MQWQRALMQFMTFFFAVVAGLCRPVPAEAGGLRIVATTPDLGAIARVVAGPEAHIDVIASGQRDPHYLEARPSYMVLLRRADLLVRVGLGLETGWLPALLRGARNADLLPGGVGDVDASRGIRLLEIPTAPVDRSQGDVHPYGNPHYWLDPLNGITIATNIAEGLARLRPEHADEYRQRAQQFAGTLRQQTQRWLQQMAPLRGTAILTYHRSWSYLEARFGLTRVGELEPKPGIPPGPRYLARLVETARKRDVRAILIEPWYDRKAADFVANALGIPVIVLPISVGGAPGVDDYVSLFDYIVQTLQATLEGTTR